MPIYPQEFVSSFLSSGNSHNCFVLMPFHNSFDDVYESIRRACESSAVLLSCSRADDFFGAGHIMEDVLRGIMASEYIVADLTGKNPNVFYELGIAHTSKAPSKVILLAQSEDDVPFDLRHMRYITYRNDQAGLRSLSGALEKAFLADSSDVYRFVVEEGEVFEFRERLSGEGHNYYTFRLEGLAVGPGSAKCALVVHRLSLNQGNVTLDPQYHYLSKGRGGVPIEPTNWEILLDRTENDHRQRRAFFAVRRIRRTIDVV